jgi:hypothetical protein
MLQPTVWDDPDLANVTPTERLLFIGLISLADDYGHISAHPMQLRKWIFGYDDFTTEQVREMRDHLLTSCRNLTLYTVEGQEYIHIANMDEYLPVRERRERRIRAGRTGRIHRESIVERDRSTCYLCGRELGATEITLDHVIPLARGGAHTEENLRVACRSCNSRKGAR